MMVTEISFNEIKNRKRYLMSIRHSSCRYDISKFRSGWYSGRQKKSKISVLPPQSAKVYILYGNPYQLRFSVSRRAVPTCCLVRNVTSRLYYDFCQSVPQLGMLEFANRKARKFCEKVAGAFFPTTFLGKKMLPGEQESPCLLDGFTKC